MRTIKALLPPVQPKVSEEMPNPPPLGGGRQTLKYAAQI